MWYYSPGEDGREGHVPHNPLLGECSRKHSGVWQFLLKVQIHLSYDPAILLLREMKTYLHIKTSTWIIIAALCLTAPNRKQLVFQWMNGKTNCGMSIQWGTILQ